MTDIYARCHAAGGMSAYEWRRDPKRIGFILARYKFVAKMLAGKARVLEVGCADGYGSRVVRQTVGHLTAIDIDAQSIREARETSNTTEWPIEFVTADILDNVTLGNFDAVYALDVLEHVAQSSEYAFVARLKTCAPVAVIGMPSIESQVYASELSRQGHVNCKTATALRATLLHHFGNVFMFGMNDEVLHTGFDAMRQYHLALCVS